MELQYKRIIHYLGQLILNQDYQRAVFLGSKILQKGFKTNQLLIMMSYAIKMSKGNSQAIEFIQKIYTLQKQLIQVNPLLQFAKGQYYGDLCKYEESSECYKKLLFQQNKNQNKFSECVSTPLSLISQNYSQISTKKRFKLGPISQNLDKKIIINLDQDVKNLIQEVNSVTKEYKNQIIKKNSQKNNIKIAFQQQVEKQKTHQLQLARASEQSQETVSKHQNNLIYRNQYQQNQMKNSQQYLNKLKFFEEKYNKIKRKFIKIIYDCQFSAQRMEKQKSIHKKKSLHIKKPFQNKTNSIYKSLSKEKFSSQNKLRRVLKKQLQPQQLKNHHQKIVKKGSQMKSILIQINKFIKFINSQISSKQKLLQKNKQDQKRTIKNSFEYQKQAESKKINQ